jgi:hypothetical protein
MTATPTITEWQLVPTRIAEVLPQALVVKMAHEQAALKSGLLATTAATWMPELNGITLYSAEQLDKNAYAAYEQEIYADGRILASVSYNAVHPDWNEEILVKRGSLVPGLPTVWNAGNKMLGGPTPLSNGIMTGLLAGGAGYGAGMLAEQLFPSRYIQRGKLRRTLGMIGALGGLGVAGLNSYANAKALRTSMLAGLFTNNKTPVVYPYEEAREKKSYPIPSGGETGAFLNEPMFAPTVSVPQFNSAAWQDVNRGLYHGFQNHTPPQFAAATTGLMTGISTSVGSPIIRPIDVVRGIASAGVGLATANIAGKALSALAGLTPEGQNKLQELGLWGGMMHAMVPSLFGR